jgi:hypothetical protein
MIRNVRVEAVTILAVGMMLVALVPARADVLLSLINPTPQINAPYAPTFTATSSATIISIAGYQSPYYETSSDNGVFLNGVGANLLGQNWKFTPATSDSYAIQYDDGTGVNALLFGGYAVGDYDIFSQTIATQIGSSYTIDLLYSQYAYYGVYAPSALMVLTSLPEPASWALLGAALFVVGLGRTWLRRPAKAHFRIPAA